MHRKEILETGIKLTTGDRNIEYGEPFDNQHNTALLWTAYLEGKYNIEFYLDQEDVNWLNVLQKISRTFIGDPKMDTYVDASTYSAMAGEAAGKLRPEEKEEPKSSPTLYILDDEV